MKPDTYHAAVAAAMSETELQNNVNGALKRFDWLWYHTYDSRRSPKGFLDLCAVREERLLFAELKTEKGAATPDQEEWLHRLLKVRELDNYFIEVYLWRPSDWLSGEIQKVLQ